MDNQFSIKDINNYKKETKTRFLKNSARTDVVLAIFDKNYDKKISKTEFDSISTEDYKACIDNLKKSGAYKNETFFAYEELNDFLECDGTIVKNELEGKIKTHGLKNLDLEEAKNLKDSSQMNADEIVSELLEYRIAEDKNKPVEDLRKELNEIREERSNYDKNSNITDGHIGTFVQGDNSMCTFLALLDTMSDDQIKKMYQQKIDNDGKVYFEVTFPSDKQTGKVTVVTQDELNNMAIDIEENGKHREIVGFSTGDGDVTLLEMAYVKRFGSDLFNNGGWISETKNKVMSDGTNSFVSNKNLENIDDYSKIPKNTTIASLTANDIYNKGLMLFSKLSDGRIANISAGKLTISDGTEINTGHAMAVKGFDKDTNELIVSGNSFNSNSETRIPAELLKYFEMSLPKDFE